jgi:hypothetical protein
MEDIIDAIRKYGPVITIGLGVLSATPPVYKTWVRPVYRAAKRVFLKEVNEELETLKSHTRSKSLHLNRKQKSILKDLEGGNEPRV